MKVAFGHLRILLSMSGRWAGTFLVQICWDLHCWSPAKQARFLAWPTALLHFLACAGDMTHEEALSWRKHSHIVLKKHILSPQGQRGEETSMCLCHLSGKTCLLPLVYTYWVWNGLAICSLPHGLRGDAKDWVCGTPANAEPVLDAALGWARKGPGCSRLGSNRR